MKTLAVLGSLLLFCGCANMTPTQKKVAGVVAGVLIVGAIVAHNQDSGAPPAAGPSEKDGPSFPACQVQKGC